MIHLYGVDWYDTKDHLPESTKMVATVIKSKDGIFVVNDCYFDGSHWYYPVGIDFITWVATDASAAEVLAWMDKNNLPEKWFD